MVPTQSRSAPFKGAAAHSVPRNAPGVPRSRGPRTVLLAVSGMSPAILTETLWALAHPMEASGPAVIPEEIIVLTTTKGAADMERDLLAPSEVFGGLSVWQALRMELLGPDAATDPRLNLKEIRPITMANPAEGRSVALEDIRTPAQNEAAAEFILDQVRLITANDDTRLICSLAGGRKTMGALLASALSLLGRAGDRLTHVLVNEPFENRRLKPAFFFPTHPALSHSFVAEDGRTATVSSADARLQLTDVPFVPLRYLFRDQLGRFPGGFMSLVKQATNLVRQDSVPIELAFDPGSGTATFDGTPIEFTGRDLVFFEFLCERARAGEPPFATHHDTETPFGEFLSQWAGHHPGINLEFSGADWRKSPPQADDFRKRLNSLRERFRKAGLGHLVPRLLPPHGALGFPHEHLVFLGLGGIESAGRESA